MLMDMKLETKHIAPYFPYNLTCYGASDIWTIHSVGFENIQFYNGIHLQECSIDDFNADYSILLKPLSDLTKEIEVNGERFVPIEIIGKLFVETGSFEEGFFGWGISTGGDDYEDYYFNIAFNSEVLHLETWCGEPNYKHSYVIETHAIEYTIYNQLIKWHFDVFNLIPQNLAIDINKL